MHAQTMLVLARTQVRAHAQTSCPAPPHTLSHIAAPPTTGWPSHGANAHTYADTARACMPVQVHTHCKLFTLNPPIPPRTPLGRKSCLSYVSHTAFSKAEVKRRGNYSRKKRRLYQILRKKRKWPSPQRTCSKKKNKN